MNLVFDIGATNTRLALVRGGRLLNPSKFPTPRTFDKALKSFADYVGARRLYAIAGCLPGHRDLKSKKWGYLRNLPAWSLVDFNGELRRRFGCRVYAENDVALAALGEARHGAGRGKSIVAYVTISTGVNGARVVDGKLDRVAWGWSIGRQMISKSFDLESQVSGAGLHRRFGRPAEEIRGASVWKAVHKTLALGLFNTLLYWSPEVLVLGGGIVNSGAIKLSLVKAELSRLRARMKANVPQPAIVRSELGQRAGLYGAMEYLKQFRLLSQKQKK